ncbi:hypothetical protein Pelo_441 [Pelomyxa schiedti]|nr:hypothetical protein Pelo_441 [Pelomyxa schiedti]
MTRNVVAFVRVVALAALFFAEGGARNSLMKQASPTIATVEAAPFAMTFSPKLSVVSGGLVYLAGAFQTSTLVLPGTSSTTITLTKDSGATQAAWVGQLSASDQTVFNWAIVISSSDSGSVDNVYAMCPNPSGGVYAVGICSSTTKFGVYTSTTTSIPQSIFVVNIPSTGVVAAAPARANKQDAIDYALTCVADSSNVYVGGIFNGRLTLDQVPNEIQNTGFQQGWVAVYSVASSTYRTAIAGSNFTTALALGTSTLYVAWYDATGPYEARISAYTKTLTSTGSPAIFTSPYFVSIDGLVEESGVLYVSGRFKGSVSLGGTSFADVTSTIGTSSMMAFVAKVTFSGLTLGWHTEYLVQQNSKSPWYDSTGSNVVTYSALALNGTWLYQYLTYTGMISPNSISLYQEGTGSSYGSSVALLMISKSAGTISGATWWGTYGTMGVASGLDVIGNYVHTTSVACTSPSSSTAVCKLSYAQLLPCFCSSGICTSAGICLCDTGYGGPQCATQCPGTNGDCNGHGTCDRTDGTCNCDYGYAEPSCSATCCGGGKGSCSGGSTCLQCDTTHYDTASSCASTCTAL